MVSIEYALDGAIDVSSKARQRDHKELYNKKYIVGMAVFGMIRTAAGTCATNTIFISEHANVPGTGFMGIQFNGNNITIRIILLIFIMLLKMTAEEFILTKQEPMPPGTVYLVRQLQNIVLNGTAQCAGIHRQYRCGWYF